MKRTTSAISAVPFTLALAAAGAAPAAADGLDEGQARSRIQAAGYANVAEVHEGNLGEWMAQASKDGRQVLVVVHPDGSVGLRQSIATPPAQLVPGAPPAKP